ncbi:unnamed protein product [Linum tenue]|uniref:Homing endonuclease LAGLIDADG domain-containing protein n=1 Tax=Linum tenue TaxID=586396 RepID=A0AAV0MLV8_9ROSI|nr:unnamed protein product [Linum tenue]
MNFGPIAQDIQLTIAPLPSNPNPLLSLSSHMRLSLLSSPLSFLRCLTSSFSRLPRRRAHSNYCTHHRCRLFLRSLPEAAKTHQPFPSFQQVSCLSHSVEQLACEPQSSEPLKNWDFSNYDDSDSDLFNLDDQPEAFKFEGGGAVAGRDTKHLESPGVEVKELEEVPEQWRRSRLAWLCKELPAHKSGSVVRILNGQRKWMRQDDATYVVVHCTRIRENEAAFKVYKWMMLQRWYRFDFALATKLADYLGKERKFLRCREIFDDIINQGRVPSESTFHILVVAYLGASIEGCLDEACTIYNRMIQLGGYSPRLSLHNSLFKALVAKPGDESKNYLKQAEFIYHNLVTTGLEVQQDIYGGLIWLHSYQEVIDKERIMQLRDEMGLAGMEEVKDVLVSILRACAKDGDVEEAEKTWLKLISCNGGIPSLAFVYRMEVFAEAGVPMKSLETFRSMQELLKGATITGYQKIIEILCNARHVELAELHMQGLVQSGLKPLTPSYVEMATMYLGLSMHEKVEPTFLSCLEKCRPNRAIYNLYLDSLLKAGNFSKAEEIFNHMQSTEAIGVGAGSCNAILSGYLASGNHVKAEKVYDLMCKKRYDVESSSMEKLEYVLSLTRKEVKKPVSLKLSAEQREALVGLLLGGLQIDSDEPRKKHMIRFVLNENSNTHSVLRRHLYDQYHEWLHPSCRRDDDSGDAVPFRFSTIAHSYFGFYADQFWPRGRPTIPKMIHRWLSPRALAYWYMYGGYRLQSGDILLKLKGDSEGVEKVVKALRARSLECRVKRKGRVFWIGFFGNSSTWFWKLVEPYVLDGLQDYLQGGNPNDSEEAQGVNFDSESDVDGEESEQNDSSS